MGSKPPLGGHSKNPDRPLSFVFCVFKEQQFSRVVPKKHLYLPILTTKQEKTRVKNSLRVGPVCLSHTELVPVTELHPLVCRLATCAHTLIVTAKLHVQSFARLRPSRYRSSITPSNINYGWYFWKSKRTRKASGEPST